MLIACFPIYDFSSSGNLSNSSCKIPMIAQNYSIPVRHHRISGSIPGARLCLPFRAAKIRLYSLPRDLNPALRCISASPYTLGESCYVNANSTSKLPVALFVTGGDGVTVRIDVPSQLPAHWVSPSQEHIVITINCGVIIFGVKFLCLIQTGPSIYWCPFQTRSPEL